MALSTAAAQTAMAQTEDPVTMYGRVYVMFDVVEAKGGTAPPLVRRNRVSDQSSLLGVRGTESLGGGLKAFFQLETGFSPDAASGAFAQRNSAVGLQHASWGSLSMGRWDMPFKLTQDAVVDPFTDLSIADITGTALNQGNFANREQNIVQYWSPEWAGLTLRLAYAANEARTAARNPYKFGGSLSYGRGDYYVAYAYEKHHDYSDGTATTGVNQEGNGISGYFRLGTAKTQKGWALGLDWVFAGNSHLLVLYQRSTDGGANNAVQPSCDAIGVGYRYDFSRRTMFQANYVRVSNKTGNLCNFGAGALNIAEGQDPRGFAAGVRHTF
jgi:predicted porin